MISVEVEPSVVGVAGFAVPSAGASAGVCSPGHVFFGTVPSAKYSVRLLQVPSLAISPVSEQMVLVTTDSGISNGTDLYL